MEVPFSGQLPGDNKKLREDIFLGIVAMRPLIKQMRYNVKIKRYKVPDTHKKSALFF